MIETGALLTDLRLQLKRLEQDLAERAESVPEMSKALDAEYRSARDAGRTGDTFSQWRAAALTQAAVAWLLGCVFVRFVEDNQLVEAPLITGTGNRASRAADRQTLFFRGRPTDTDRDYLLDVFAVVAELPAMAKLYDRQHNPVWRSGISGDSARDLLAFWRIVDPDSGTLHHDFTDPRWDTRFLGDLYQDLSDDAKKRYALLQTPEFVEEFILDRTLDPAIDEFGLAETRMIDPTCGSGHFLIGGFRRLAKMWFEREPAVPERVLVQRALDGVYGVDLNPFAVAIARFRLLIAALKESHITRLKDAPGFGIHVAAGDSLLHGRRFDELDLGSGSEQLAGKPGIGHAFFSEDLTTLNRILGQQYQAVVGNPPYITVKDRAVSTLYRARYASCHMKYALSVPFAERFFDLAIEADGRSSGGYVGQITSNAFMKREFGKKLIEEFFPNVDLNCVIDTSGAYIPGHGTPTVIIFGRNRAPVSKTLRCVLGLRGEPETPNDPGAGRVWTAIVGLVDSPGQPSEWVESVDLARDDFNKHPWSLGSESSTKLFQLLEGEHHTPLSKAVDSIGITAFTLEDSLYLLPRWSVVARQVESAFIRDMVVGDELRDWACAASDVAMFPYSSDYKPATPSDAPRLFRVLWLGRTLIAQSKMFGGKTKVESGLAWYEFGRLTSSKLQTPLSIPFAFVATHNHFVLDRGGKVFNRSAPVIKLPEGTSEEEHLALVGLLNSSVACFWMKQIFYPKGGDHVGTDGARVRKTLWDERYEFTGTGLKKFPLPDKRPLELAIALDHLAIKRQSELPAGLADQLPIAPTVLDQHRQNAADSLVCMIALQEELDWQCYHLYGVTKSELTYQGVAGARRNPPHLELGQRAFEIVLARQMAAGHLETTWFERHGSTPTTELPASWPPDYRSLVERRIALIESDRFIGLLEKPEYKRRWNLESWENQERRTLRDWLLDRLESPAYWPEAKLISVRDLADRAASDADFRHVAARYLGHEGADLQALIAELVEDESVPALPVLRYKQSGLAKRADYEATWTLQRAEDTIDAEVMAATPQREGESAEDYAERLNSAQRERKDLEVGPITPPPKYRSADFLKPSYWRLRGALDVPKERFVSFPHMSRDADPSLLVGWGGWDALTLSQAVAAYYTELVDQEGWTAERLVPLLAVLREQLPWLKQWHNELDPTYNQRLGDFFETFIQQQLAAHELTDVALQNWRPQRTTHQRRGRGADTRGLGDGA